METGPDSCHIGQMDKKPKRPRDLAKLMIDIATGEVSETMVPDKEKDPAAVARGRAGGLKGGNARAAKTTKEARSTIAKNAAQARWSKG